MHDSTDLPLARRQRIADRLRGGQSVVAGTLAAEFGVSEDAIRRDLRALAQEGVCRRVYGGALPLSPAGAPVSQRLAEDGPRKAALAAAAVRLIQPGMAVFLDTGSTTLQLAHLLPGGLTVITNSLPAAAVLMARTDLALHVIGGQVSPAVGGAVDAGALAALARVRVDLGFLGACAMSLRHGLAGFDSADAAFKARLARQSAATVLMLASAKIETQAPFAICPAGAVTHYVLDPDAPAAVIAALAAAGARLHLSTGPEA